MGDQISKSTTTTMSKQTTAPPVYSELNEPVVIQAVPVAEPKQVPVTPAAAPVYYQQPAAVPVAAAAVPRAVPAPVYYRPVDMVEVEEISPAGWLCCILTCPFIFPFNFLGLCMTERRLVPAHAVYY